MSLYDAIGVGSQGRLGIVGFSQENFAPPGREGAVVSIKTGLSEVVNEPHDSLAGTIDRIYGFNNRNELMGNREGCHTGSGGTCTKELYQYGISPEPRYISVTSTTDATCISWISVTQIGDMPPTAWTGDIGWYCGQKWYNSLNHAGRLLDSHLYYFPKCTWVDADNTNYITAGALKFDTKAYGEDSIDTFRGNVCKPTIFAQANEPIGPRPQSAHPQSVFPQPAHPHAAQPDKRGTEDRPLWMTERLIMSNFTSHPAEELCSSATSWGPDFIGSDGKFCDMGSKTLIPLCSSKDIDGCIEVDEDNGTLVKRMSVARRFANIVHKNYRSISKWEE
ncbi:hypothetical protein Ptr902_04019 [Pyrenophora tritici-repentis]|nr:hypothetical protein Ptr902_04019 [Pyrenophora tritici-repentis]